MAYNPTTWVNGVTKLNASNLNNIEDGVLQNSLDVFNFIRGVRVTATDVEVYDQTGIINSIATTNPTTLNMFGGSSPMGITNLFSLSAAGQFLGQLNVDINGDSTRSNYNNERLLQSDFTVNGIATTLDNDIISLTSNVRMVSLESEVKFVSDGTDEYVIFHTRTSLSAISAGNVDRQGINHMKYEIPTSTIDDLDFIVDSGDFEVGTYFELYEVK